MKIETYDEATFARVVRWAYNPEQFMTEAFRWDVDKGEWPTDYQLDAWAEIVPRRRVSVRSGNGAGKTTIMACAVIWFAVTREVLGIDWKVPTTASVNRQLVRFLWPEVRKRARRLRWDLIPLAPWRDGHELLEQTIKGEFGQAFTVASNDPGNIEGAHADHLLYVFDEAKMIGAETWAAAEGAFSNAGLDGEHHEAYALAGSTPGAPSGPYYEKHMHRPGWEDWWCRHVTAAETLAAGRVSQEWIDNRRRQWGAESPIFLNRVLGQFSTSAENVVVPHEWVELAIERWIQAVDEGRQPTAGEMVMGCDLAAGGGDLSVLAKRQGWFCHELVEFNYANTMETTGRIKASKGLFLPRLDVGSFGLSVYQRLVEQGVRCEPFNGSNRTEVRDRSGELEFLNRRACSWWHIRDLVDPHNPNRIALPPNDQMVADLTAPTFRYTSSGKIQLEPKERTKKRIGRSPDFGDAVVIAFAPHEPVEPPAVEHAGVWAEEDDGEPTADGDGWPHNL